MEEYEFSSESNLVLGLNGHGKSNLLLAIDFVFSANFDKLDLDEKLRITHEGGNHKPSRVSVELTIDNSKHLIPIQGVYFVLRREMDTHTGKDAYFLDGRSISKTDLHNIFKMSDISQFNDVAKLV